ncbi:MAG: hypothetical protein KF760_26305 [Candidatus Eremiobacteraeota bacterium]|nr:hypothetical protein [Candidatus Eremiobacteraeota bacterium]MCW5871877.1 hypothetical protein [Candidatus Eremiobacteraeota bacterium]
MRHTAERRTGEVLNFATSSEAYTIYIEPDVRLDVARVQNKQADGSREAYMWVQAVQGFFVLYQDLREARPGPWRLIFEIIPESFSSSFFPYVEDEFFPLLQEWQKVDSPPLDNNPGE